MKKTSAFKILLLFTLHSSLFTLSSAQSVTPLWLRDVMISPDGSKIAFCYKGDIWTVPTSGGTATRITTQDSYEANPIWSPDGRQIAFSTDRNGGLDIYVMPAEGGKATRLTFNSANEIPSSFSPDGKLIYFSATIQDPAESAMFPYAGLTELYSVPVKGGKSVQVLGTPAEMLSWSKDGSYFIYQDRKGGEDEWRKHHTSSITRDIWRYDVKTGKHTNLTNRAGEDRNPVLSEDGKTIYFLKEVSQPSVSSDGSQSNRLWGSMNVWSMPLASKEGATASQLTSFKTHPVRFLSMGGGKLCFTWDGEIYTMTPNGKPDKVDISLTLDEENETEILKRSSGAGSGSVSPDGKQVAFIVRGEVFVTSVEYNTTKQITHTAAAERSVDFGKDNRSLVYASERDGLSQLYLAKISRKEDPNFPNATIIDEEPLLKDLKVERSHPTFSPDGKEVAFIENRTKLKVVNLDSKAVREVTDGSTWYSQSSGFSYSWSPDGKWFVIEYTANGHEPYNDVGLVSSKGGEITNITASGYMSGNARWVMDGNAILFQTEMFGLRAHASWGSQYDAMLCFLNQDTYDKFRLSKEDYELRKELDKNPSTGSGTEDKKEEKKGDKKDEKKDDKKDDKKDVKPIEVELDGIRDRIVRLTPNSSDMGDAILSKDGETMYYLAAFEGGMDLWKMDLRKKETKLISKGAGSGMFTTDGEGKTIFLMGSSLKKMDGDNLKPITFTAEMKLDHQAEREYMFNYVVREEQQRFYTKSMHGVDWTEMANAYKKFLPHISNNYDFAELLSELLGELNVSHTGGRYYPAGSAEPTASLGLLFDMSYTGKGLKVAEVIKGGPFDHANLKLKAGDIITKIDGTDITDEQDVSTLLMGKSGKKTLVCFENPSLQEPQGKLGSGTGDKNGEAVILPVSKSKMNDLLYDRWVKQREEDVKKWSNGRLGYVHIKQMNDNSFRPLYSDVLGKFNKCDGIVIDTRFNGGGRMHEDIEVLFSGEKYLTQVIRGRETCDMPSRRWNKPSIMLQCEANYSNAHGTPWVYSHQKIGKLVGAPVPGTMTSVNWVTMQDPDLVFGIPVIGYRTDEGHYLEGSQLEPDVLVLNSPETVVKGEDTQLRTAVEELLKEIGK